MTVLYTVLRTLYMWDERNDKMCAAVLLCVLRTLHSILYMYCSTACRPNREGYSTCTLYIECAHVEEIRSRFGEERGVSGWRVDGRLLREARVELRHVHLRLDLRAKRRRRALLEHIIPVDAANREELVRLHSTQHENSCVIRGEYSADSTVCCIEHECQCKETKWKRAEAEAEP